MNQIATLGFCFLAVASCRNRFADNSSVKSSTEQKNYSIRATVEVIKPVNLDAMNTSWQSGRKVSETANTITLDITVFPFKSLEAGVVANPNWRRENAANSALTQYLKPGITSNWDEAMRNELIALLKTDGIEPSKLDDLALVQYVSDWIMNSRGRFKYKSFFVPFYVSFNSGAPTVIPALQQPFNQEKMKAGYSSDAQAVQEGLFGKSMFEKRWRGDCTSTAILQSTILKALGIPTRLVVSIPLVDFNNPAELDLVRSQIHNMDAKQAILSFSEHSKGFWSSHTFNEVYIGRQWVRLNYNRVGQGLIDKDYLGVMLQVQRASDWSQMGLATWALHVYGKTSTKLASINPYRTLELSDAFANRPSN